MRPVPNTTATALNMRKNLKNLNPLLYVSDFVPTSDLVMQSLLKLYPVYDDDLSSYRLVHVCLTPTPIIPLADSCAGRAGDRGDDVGGGSQRPALSGAGGVDAGKTAPHRRDVRSARRAHESTLQRPPGVRESQEHAQANSNGCRCREGLTSWK